MGNPVLVIMIETFSLEEVGWGFAMVQICRVKLIPFAGSQMNPAKPFFFFKLKFFFDKKIKVFLSIKSKIIILKKNK